MRTHSTRSPAHEPPAPFGMSWPGKGSSPSQPGPGGSGSGSHKRVVWESFDPHSSHITWLCCSNFCPGRLLSLPGETWGSRTGASSGCSPLDDIEIEVEEHRDWGWLENPNMAAKPFLRAGFGISLG